MKSFVALICVAFYLSGSAQQQLPAAVNTNWIGTWATSQQGPERQNNPAAQEAGLLTDATVRQVIHISVRGASIRLHLSNEFGIEPLTIDSVEVAKAVDAASTIDPVTGQAVTFDGRRSVVIPAGAQYISDPIPFAVAPLSDVAISLYLAKAPSVQTTHPGSRATSFFVHGRHTSDIKLDGAVKVEHWFQIAAMDVAAPSSAKAIVVLGDSITDGHASTTDGNDRWTDVLASRLQASAAGRNISVLNEGIGGNRLLTDGLGNNALARMDRDVLAQSGLRYVFVLEGINDVGMLARSAATTPEDHAALVQNMIAAYEQIVLRAHAHGLKVIGATMTPFVGSAYYHAAPANEADRQQVNAWIRMPGHFDAVVDFDALVRDPANPSRMLPAADSGDHLHPGPAGYRMMGNAVPLGLFY